MCTVSIVPADGGVRIVCNRDESRSRPPALAPELRTIEDRAALFPVDGSSGGTWIGLNDAGLALVMLNRTIAGAAPRPQPAASRGAIIPRLLGQSAIRHAIDAALSLDPREFALFRLLVVRGETLGVVVSDGSRLTASVQRVVEPQLFTSSSLGDRWVEGPRGTLFERILRRDARGWRRGQHVFHRHQWRRRPHISVVMARADARTVSRTVIDATTHRASLRYEPLEAPRVADVVPALRGAA